MISVLVSCPNGSGWIHKNVAFALMRILGDTRVDKSIILPTHSPFVNNLHKIRLDFLKGDFDYWLSMDDDNPPIKSPIDVVLEAHEKQLHFVGLPTPVWANFNKGERPYYYNAYKKNGDGYLPWEDNPVGLQEVDAVGTGCFIASKQIMQMISAPFMRTWDGNGIVEKGNDISFCERAKALGFSIYCHFDYLCQHFNEIELNEVIAAFNEMGVNHGN